MPTARTHLRFSVVIATTRGSIHDTLAGLRRQTYRDFEVIVVLGSGAPDPSELGPRVKTVRCDTLNISLARNLGVQAAAGEIVAFIDDDAVPEAT
jgi:glycosyltransferase involved in cell wall biosynthesis